MDNILKYILGVLGVAALLALIVPKDVSVKGPSADEPIKPIAPVTAPTGPIAVKDPPSDDNEASDDQSGADEEYASFGQPMSDPSPVGGGNNSSSSIAPQSYGPPAGSALSQPQEDLTPTVDSSENTSGQ